jgi:hypothetical protein
MVDGMSELQALRYQLDQLDREPPIGTANGNGGNGDASAGSGDGKDVESILRRSVAQLKRSMLVQKRGHSKEVQHLTHELKEARQNEERLEQLLDERERHARAQVRVLLYSCSPFFSCL